jgi:hypothetical protein
MIRITLSEETVDGVIAAIEQVTAQRSTTVETHQEIKPRKNQVGGVAEGLRRAPH